MALRSGDSVGARRWPSFTAHQSNWGRPLRGQLLDLRDPQAWAGTAAFAGQPAPRQSDVDDHVDRLMDDGGLGTIPVLWCFGEQSVVLWEAPHRVVPYAEDYRAWLLAKSGIDHLEHGVA